MPESFDPRTITREGAPKPARIGGSQGAANTSPAGGGAAGGGLDSPRVDRKTFEAGSTRAETSAIKRTGAAVASFSGGKV